MSGILVIWHTFEYALFHMQIYHDYTFKINKNILEWLDAVDAPVPEFTYIYVPNICYKISIITFHYNIPL